MNIYTHPACFKHNPSSCPRQAPHRIDLVLKALKTERFKSLGWREPSRFSPEELYAAHQPDYVADVLRPIKQGEERSIGLHSIAVEGTAEAALFAAGAVVLATSDVLSGATDKAFCVISPPGHHAEADAASGFCFFNNIALAALIAQKKGGLKKIAVLDFDAHHGNGTQSLFWNFEDRLFISLHEETPLSGLSHETGAWNNILNLPLPPRSGGVEFRRTFETAVNPKLEAFKPDLLFVSAGFDMHTHDPLSTLCLKEDDYKWLGESLRRTTQSLCQGRLVAALEGGYNLDVLGNCVAEFVAGIEGL